MRVLSANLRGHASPLIAAALVALVAAALFGATGCARNRRRTGEIRIDNFRSAECAYAIRRALARANPEGAEQQIVLRVEPDPARGVVTVTWDDALIHRMNLVALLNAAGFDADGLPGNPAARARLPEACR